MKKFFRIGCGICGLLIATTICVTGCSKSTSEVKKETKETDITTVSEETTTEMGEKVELEIFETYVVTCSKVNVRAEPNTKSQILDVYYKNTVVTASQIENENWCKVICDDEVVYVSSDYLADITANEAKEYTSYQIKEKKEMYGMISESAANVRLLPSTNTGTIIGKINKGNVLEIIGITVNDWYVIEYNNDICYISKDVVTILTEEEYQSYITKIEKGIFEETNSTLIGSYSTDYTPANTNRGYNVELASAQIDSFVIPPNAVFNWCRDMGPCGKDEGYKSSNEIVNGQYVTGYGGGICQISSTLCAAIIQSEGEFEFIERYKHSKAQPYIPRELDATVSYPNTNFVVKNCNDYPVIIKSYCNEGKITVEIYKIG